MATISLKAYISRVDTLLTVGNLDEVVHHCRHILVSYPRNAEASHMLGQALVQMGGNASEAQAVLCRVLAIMPDDAATHAALGEVSEHNGLFQEAIWHLERASEHATENRSYRERLRSLYRLHRGAGAELPEGLPGAVARRQLRENQRVQAIRTLQNALQDAPGRQDLRLLLARTQWDVEKRVDAADTALDVLEALPWCLHANRIVANLWLAELRPTDAQQFLERIHDVDPYLALRLASNNPPDEHSFTLTELDYRQFGNINPPANHSPAISAPGGNRGPRGRLGDDFQSDITDGSLPDWLQESVTSESEQDELAWLEGDAPATAAASSADGVLPWESNVPVSPRFTSSPQSHDEGDELDWLNNPAAGETDWMAESAATNPGAASTAWSEKPDAHRPPAPATANEPLRSALPPVGVDPDGVHSRQQQFVFSRLPLWLRVPAEGLPVLKRASKPGRARRRGLRLRRG